MDWLYGLVGAGTVLAIIIYIVYLVRQGATDHAAVEDLSAQNKVEQAKVKSLDDRIVDAEYRRRVEEKKKNAELAKTTTGSAALGVLRDSIKGPNGPN